MTLICVKILALYLNILLGPSISGQMNIIYVTLLSDILNNKWEND